MGSLNSDIEFDKLWKSKFENYQKEFEEACQKARDKLILIDHLERTILSDLPTSRFANHYIAEIIYTFYHLYNLGSPVDEICNKILDIRKEHLLKIAEKPDNYERSSMGFNITVQDKSSIINFFADHYAKNEYINFLKQRKQEKEISTFSTIPPSTKLEGAEEIKKDKPTNAQKLLVFYYLQKVNLFPQSLDVLPLSEFITFLTGQNQKNTYDQLREIHDYKMTRKNLVVIRQQFVRMGLHDVVALIDIDMKECWK